MPTDKDRDSASIRYEGEARRLTIRWPRLDRDGLFLLGRRHAAQIVTLTGDELAQLGRGRMIAVDALNEYLIYIKFSPQADQGCTQ